MSIKKIIGWFIVVILIGAFIYILVYGYGLKNTFILLSTTGAVLFLIFLSAHLINSDENNSIDE